MRSYKKVIPTMLAVAAFALPAAAFAQNDATQNMPATSAGAVGDQANSQAFELAHVTGAVARAQGGVLELQSGQDVYINPDTVINGPLSTRIRVTGYLNEADGSIEATEIDSD